MAKTSEALDVLAAEDMKAERFSDAISKYTELLEKVPGESVRWFCARGNGHLKKGSATEALEDGKKAKRLDETSVEACILCGRASSQLGFFVESLDYYKEGLKIDPKRKAITEDLKKLQKIILQDQEKQTTKEDSSYSAVTLCSQSIYPGDDQLLTMEKEILEVKYKILDDPAYSLQTPPKKRDAQLEGQLVQAAYEFFTAERLEEALELMSKLITLDPRNLFYRTFRAQIYFNMSQWPKVIQDYWVIPKAQRKAEIWKQGGKAFVELWLPVLAEFWLRKATQLSGGKDEEAAMLFQKVRVRRLYEPLTEDQPVQVDFTQFGRAVFAKEDIPAGETVMMDIPMVIAQSLSTRHIPACANCATSLISPEIYFEKKLNLMGKEQQELIEDHWPKVSEIWCEHCGKERYCSNICKNEAWEVYHRVICPRFNPGADTLYAVIEQGGFGYTADGKWDEVWKGHFSPMILVKIWANIASQVRTMMENDGVKEPTVEHWARAKAPYRRFIAFGTMPAMQRMPHALPMFQAAFADCGGGLSYKITEDEFNGRYYQAACNLQSFSCSITPYHHFMNNIKDDLRGIGVLKHLSDRPPEAQFAALCPLHACSNHSCLNNAEVCDLDINGRPGVQMIARRDIKKGEEIFITYIDTSMPKTLRKAWLFKSFNFWCQCKRCQFEGDTPSECTHCLKKAPEDKKFAACGKCKRAWYCGAACQKASWKNGHKIVCQTPHSQAVFDT
ncbi:uncharacterized protein LOC101858898 [Aplysia californica]|uniref:Uncharacterized protein LOC101858898 n=1 Tax=Aplysia californica TaxID=6500 RepID=A0ABM1AAY6_APLCA|nr:uncharacterized protein LOC101858898 [Aplysia californica]